jgi:hypothetical protein
MDEDLPHVTEALRGTVCVGVALLRDSLEEEQRWDTYGLHASGE